MSTVVVESLLYKQGEKGFVKGWKRRWCYIKRGDTKLYYCKQKGVEHINFINLLDAETVDICERARGKDEFGFQIVTPTRTWNLSTAFSKLRDLWVQTIRHVINNKGHSIKQPPIQPTSNNKFDKKYPILVKSESTSSLSSSPNTGGSSSTKVKHHSGLSKSVLLVGSVLKDSDDFKSIPINTNKNIKETVNIQNFVDNEFSEESGLFELEEEVDTPKPPFLSIVEESQPEPRRSNLFLTPIRMASSLPVNIPHKNFGGRFSDFIEDEDDNNNTSFLKPHELAARTYHEHYMKSFGREFDVPVSNTRKIKAYI